MRRLPFLTSPGAWIRCSSRMTDTARDAIAIERSRSGPPWKLADALMVALLVISIALAIGGWI